MCLWVRDLLSVFPQLDMWGLWGPVEDGAFQIRRGVADGIFRTRLTEGKANCSRMSQLFVKSFWCPVCPLLAGLGRVAPQEEGLPLSWELGDGERMG